MTAPAQAGPSRPTAALLQGCDEVIKLAAFPEAVPLRFELIDRVVSREADSLRAIKTVTAAEEYLADHFPEFPVLPGVLMLESLVQAGRAWVAGSTDPPDRPLVVTEVRNLRYGQMVRPGETLSVEVSLRKQEGDTWQFQGTGTVHDQVAVQGRFALTPLPG